MRHFLILATAGVLAGFAHASGTVTFNLSSPSNGATVSPGELIEWTITVSVSTGDNLGLALAAVDLVQDGDIATGDLHSDDLDEWGIERISATGFRIWDKHP